MERTAVSRLRRMLRHGAVGFAVLFVGAAALLNQAGSGTPTAGRTETTEAQTVPAGTSASPQCLAAMESLVGAPDSPDLLDRPLSECESVAAFGYALSVYPEAMGLRPGVGMLVATLQSACASPPPGAIVCVDALNRGIG